MHYNDKDNEVFTLADLGLDPTNFEEDVGQWGGNKTFKFLKDKLHEPCYAVKDTHTNRIYEGPLGIDVVQWLLDWKSSTNASDISADMVIKMFTKLCIPFKHTLPRSWH